MQLLKRVIYTLILSVFLVSCANSREPDSIKVLFIGNSYTYYNSSPELLKSMILERFPEKEVEVKLISRGGMTLKRHWEAGNVLEAISSKDWDYVVLQEQSKLGMGLIIDNDIYFGQTDHFYEYAKKLHSAIEQIGAETVFFMTWSTKNKPTEQPILTHAYNEIAKELNAKIAPVGLAWNELRNEDAFDLYDPDGSHPSVLGSYLVANTLFSTIMNESPVGVSNVISGFALSSSGEPSTEVRQLVKLTSEDAEMIQNTSWKVVENLNSNGGYLELDKPESTYIIPTIRKKNNINGQSILGKWFGTSTYNNLYVGCSLELSEKEGNLNAELSFFTPDRIDVLEVDSIRIENDILKISIMDVVRNMNSEIKFALDGNNLIGVSESFGGNIKKFKSWSLSRDVLESEINLARLNSMIQKFHSNSKKTGYVAAAKLHYKEYSEMIGENYLPSQRYLNATAFNHFQYGVSGDGLDVLELVLDLYPNSVNAYNSYGEALSRFGKTEKAVEVYKEGIELAKKIENEMLSILEANLKSIMEGSDDIQIAVPPPPPPPNR